MSSAGSVTHWVSQVKIGSPEAARQLWDRYFDRLVRLARSKLRDIHRVVADEEDVALNAFDSFCRRAADGRFEQLLDRDDLWRLLAVITVRKAIDLRRREKSSTDDARPDLEHLLSREPTPDMALQIAEECRHLFDLLGEDELRSIASWKMDGLSDEAIARKLDCAVRTVQRRLGVIRAIWGAHISSSSGIGTRDEV
jgi:DNA-directed RNA polymerase specialized sigma24 family protein